MAAKLQESVSFSSLNAVDNITFTGVRLGRGAFGWVEEADWNGTVCAAKRIHELLLQDESPGAYENLIASFGVECTTWSKLRHPGVVQFLGVYFDVNGPVLILEKMDTSLRRYLEEHNREKFPLQLKAFILRQVSQALAYLHGQNPPLVHHDLTPNNILLNLISFVTKVTDFGMSRAIDLSSQARITSIKGTLVFMPPEALQKNPRYDAKLDTFSLGNVIANTLTHEWPDPAPPTKYAGEELIALDEFQRREQWVEMFTAQEKQLFLPTVRQCLENRPDKRPSSAVLVRELRHIESSLPRGGHVAALVEQLRQQLSATEEECRQKDNALNERDRVIRRKDEVLRGKDEVLREKDEALREKVEALREMEETLREKDEALREMEETLRKKEETLREEDEVLRKKDEVIRQKNDTLRKKDEAVGEKVATNQQASFQTQHLPAIEPELEKSPVQNSASCSITLSDSSYKGSFRNWTQLGDSYQAICPTLGGRYMAVALSTNGALVVTDRQSSSVHMFADSHSLIRSFGESELGDALNGVSFDRRSNILVADSDNNRVVTFSQGGHLLRATHEPKTKLQYPSGVTTSTEGIAYVCDSGNHRIVAFDEEGKFLFEFGSKGSDPACFGFPRDVTIGSCGDVYVTDRDNHSVSVFTRQGNYLRSFKTAHEPTCIAATKSGHIILTSFASGAVTVYTREGELVHEFGRLGADGGSRQAWSPWGVAVAEGGTVCVADCRNGRILAF